MALKKISPMPTIKIPIGIMRIRAKILFLSVFAASVSILLVSGSWILSWLPTQSSDSLHGLLSWALWAVIVGVVVEELPLLWSGWKFVRLSWRGKTKEAFSKAWLHKTEILEGVGFTVLVVGLAGELALDPLIGAQQKAADLEKAGEIQVAQTVAAVANTKAANLLAENVELERALAPRDIEQSALSASLAGLQQVPIFIEPLDREEPKEIAEYLAFSFSGIKMGSNPTWRSTILPPINWSTEGISIKYISSFGSTEDGAAQKAAVAICEALKKQGVSAGTQPVPKDIPDNGRLWPNGLPKDGVLVVIGAKPNHFWINKALRTKGMSEILEMNFCTSDEFFQWADQNQKTHEHTNGSKP